jgi:hypothetical protein
MIVFMDASHPLRNDALYDARMTAERTVGREKDDAKTPPALVRGRRSAM